VAWRVKRRVPLGRLITHRFRLEQAAEAYRLFDTQTTGKGRLHRKLGYRPAPRGGTPPIRASEALMGSGFDF
jgi:hypothetical protein